MCTAKLDQLTLVIPTLDGGGTERAVLMLANYWAGRGVALTLVLFRRQGVLLDKIHPDVEVFSLDSSNPLLQVWRLAKFFKSRRPAIVCSTLNPANVVTNMACRISERGIKQIATVQNHLGAKYAHSPSLLNIPRRILIAHALRRADTVIAVSEAIKEYLVQRLCLERERVEVIYNPVAVPKSRKSDPPHPWLCDSGRPVLIAAGRLTRQKRFSLLVEAMAFLPKEIRLIILGEGDGRESLERMIREKQLESRVSLPGFQSCPGDWFVHADCYVMSSDWEGFPFVLLEAFAAGLQVVSTDCLSGPRELLEDGRYGKLVPCGDALRLAKAVEEALAVPAKRENLVERASEFSLESVAWRYTECFLRNSHA